MKQPLTAKPATFLWIESPSELLARAWAALPHAQGAPYADLRNAIFTLSDAREDARAIAMGVP